MAANSPVASATLATILAFELISSTKLNEPCPGFKWGTLMLSEGLIFAQEPLSLGCVYGEMPVELAFGHWDSFPFRLPMDLESGKNWHDFLGLN